MAKKITQKKPSKASPRKKAAAGNTAKVVKKTTKKSAVPKKSASAKSPAKKVTKKVTKKVAKKIVKKTAPSTKTAKASKTTKVKPKKTAAKTASAKSNGKTPETVTAKTPTPIRWVVRPTPPPPEPVIEDWTPLSDAKLRKIKSGLTRKDLNEFKRLLMEKRAQLIGDVTTMEKVRHAGNGGELSNMPLHMADIGSDNYEQEFTLGLVESERKLLVEIDAALMRIQNKIYGVCIISGNPIPKARLEIKPWAKYSIEVVRKREKHGLHSF